MIPGNEGTGALDATFEPIVGALPVAFAPREGVLVPYRGSSTQLSLTLVGVDRLILVRPFENCEGRPSFKPVIAQQILRVSPCSS